MPEWVEVIVRTLASIIVLFGLTKLLGKRQISQLSFFEYITGITIGDLAASISLNIKEAWYLGIISLTVWVLVSLGIEFLQLKSKKARDFIDSKSTVLIKDGKIMEDNLKKERLTNEELMQLLRTKNAFKAAEVEFALIEPNGEINVLLKKEYQPLTPTHLGIKVGPEAEPQTVVLDGKIMDEPLATLGLNRKWVHTELEKLGVSLDNVYLGQVDAYGQFYVDLFDDQIKVPEPQQKATLYADLKKCQADLEMFGLSTDQLEAKTMYEQCSTQLEQVISDVKPLLTR
ncbi:MULTISPECIES: DUF421 domain-containing protein [Paenibacillus]|uniref:YetF C-terminal domain-containing protein n=1 Tax=Paenibacillus azoreducens TaxID=116718 RepID=A0A920CRD8_9BACL|nr:MULTISPECIES: DUF421 domain-containing protein [Paenibacillus]MBE9913866.1 DUF421 domain-containing protein [Paenibacillus donghaensis]GIO48160.1 hypothetical protein J34TS1_29250 [Paenibacillus azoreducens]